MDGRADSLCWRLAAAGDIVLRPERPRVASTKYLAIFMHKIIIRAVLQISFYRQKFDTKISQFVSIACRWSEVNRSNLATTAYRDGFTEREHI